MAHRLTVERSLALKVTALAKDASDARDLLLALDLVEKVEEPAEPQLTVEPGSSYVPPAKRRQEWTRQAGELNAAGRTTAEIAVALAVDEDTAAELIGDYWAGAGR
jgi:hypothetical protein